MKQVWPALIVIAVIVVLGAVIGRASCAKPNVEFVGTGVAETKQNPLVATAVVHARNTLDSFISEYQHPKPEDKGFGVQAAFDSPRGPEHIWIHLRSYHAGKFTGTLADEPQAVQGMHKGDMVTVDRNQVTDWIYDQGGKAQGGFTIRALARPGGP